MSHFACALLGDRGRWRVVELELDGCESLDDVLELIRDFTEPVRLLAVEQDDEYAVLLRLESDDGRAGDESVQVFLTNGHSADDYPLAALFADGLDEIGGDPLLEDELAADAARSSHDAAPFGDPSLVQDLGMPASELLELAGHARTLPIELIESLCERLGCLDEFEAVRA